MISDTKDRVVTVSVVFYQRKRRLNSNFSMEFIFDDVRQRLAGKIRATVRVAPCLSNGLFRRIWIALDAWRHQGSVTHVTGDINFAAILLSSRCTVLTVLDCGFLTRTSGLKHLLLKWFWLSLPVRSAAVVTTISESARDQIIQFLGYDPGNIRVIPVAVSDAFQPMPSMFCESHPRILQIGTAPNKNIASVLQALQGMNCTLVIVGELGDDLLKLAREYQIHVENHVNLNQAEIVQQYEQADLVVFASTYEGFGMPIVEAQRVGRPVVTSNVSSMPEVAGDGACLVDPFSVSSIQEGIERIIQDREYRSQLIARGLRNSARFDADRIATQYLNVYQFVSGGSTSDCTHGDSPVEAEQSGSK